ncbi:hypothetical protein ACW2Q0_28350 [Nocardia sp. R16R-3T]
MRELTAADYDRISEQLAALQRVNMWGPAKLATVAILLIQLAKTEPLWPIPEEPVWPVEDSAPTCAPLVRAAVLPTLTPDQTWLLARAATAELHPARPPARGWAVCQGEGCAWCAWAADPKPETLPAMMMAANPFLPSEVSVFHDLGWWL